LPVFVYLLTFVRRLHFPDGFADGGRFLKYKDMNRFSVLSLLALFCLQNNLPAAPRGDVPAQERKQAERIVSEQGGGDTRVTIRTSAGVIEVLLYDETPAHRDNFLRLAEAGKYDGILFHRVISGFMIQAGDPSTQYAMATSIYGSRSMGAEIAPEIRPSLFHHRGALAAARSADEVNPQRLSSGSQFYIVQGEIAGDSLLNAVADGREWAMPEDHRTVYRALGGTPQLDGQYTVFGRVVRGMRVVDRIASRPTDYADRPRTDIYIRSMTVKKKKK
jgi:peptidyl-prolyl cis-trans isomerase B (cyclophilin B)